MLELNNINKSYKVANEKHKVLNNISIKFKKSEFVSILGPSGSGKTTLLNIIGGLDRYDSGDLIINGKSTKKFKNKDWDAYRNNSIGFIFQSYNLITHMSVLKNVELCLTLSGISRKERKQRAKQVLEKVGLKNHMYKKPNQLSGGQMQRVAIARALVNNPDIILADEPTGALDSKTSIQIMEIIKEISKDKLVIMVTHNPELAKTYSNRIITIKDGEIESDTNSYEEVINENEYKLKKTSMNFFTALSLSFNNILTKKGRTILTAFASSIGIIGISLILSLSNGFTKQIDKFERDTSDAMPIIISSTKTSIESVQDDMKALNQNNNSDKKYTKEKSVTVKKVSEDEKYNNINDDFMSYLRNINEDDISSIGLNYITSLNMIQKMDDKYYTLNSLNNENDLSIKSLPFKNFNDKSISEIITNYYDVLEGHLPEAYNEVIIEVNTSNVIEESLKKALGINKDEISFEDILNSEIKLVYNDDFYNEYDGYFIQKTIDKTMFENQNNLSLKVVGIIRGRKSKDNVLNSSSGIYYTNDLITHIMEKNNESKIVKKQDSSDYNVLTGLKFENNSKGERDKQTALAFLGNNSTPVSINIYPKNFDKKDNIIKYIDNYNKDKITYLDQAKLITNVTGGIMTGITTVLVAFSSISLIVSSIMIGIITYISVLERTKEIGILRSIGARKKDIRRVFNAETFIIGLTSGALGIFISRMLLFPINSILKNITKLDNVAIMDIKHAIILVAISIILTLIGGAIPSNIASKKNPVESLRVE